MKSINPSTEKITGEIFVSSREEIKKKVLLARKIFPNWSSLDIKKRVGLMNKFSDFFKKEHDEIVNLLRKEAGKTINDAETEFMIARGTIYYYCKQAGKFNFKKTLYFDSQFYPETKGYVKFVPHGVFGLITPWNYPLCVPIWTIVPALLAGNTIVFKPSQNAFLTGKKIGSMFDKILPPGVFNIIYGDSAAGKFLVKQNIDKLVFTGSTEGGRDILRNIGIKPVNLELGGKDAAIVCEDVNIDYAARGVVSGAVNNSGQICVSIEKVYVHEKIADRFTDKIIEIVKKLKKGEHFGPLVNKACLDKAEQHIKDAVLKGAKILVGGKRTKGKGFFLEPTVLGNLKENMKIMKEETFGPIIPICKVKNETEAIDRVNKSKYGLGVSIWTSNTEKGCKLGEKIEVGMVWINDATFPTPGGDYWGGTKMSGLRNTENKFSQCLKAKTFVINISGKRDYWFS